MSVTDGRSQIGAGARTKGADVELQGISKRFGTIPAVTDVSLAVAPGELVSLLGPSGCGKTTTLRLVAGFIEPDAGRIMLKGADITTLPPDRRDLGMLFQNYALFPHLTVVDNVAFGLKMRGVRRGERRRLAEQALERVRLREHRQRYPHELSGGQQQRVALARAVVIQPSVLLLDEPLSNLDARLRQDLRMQIRDLQQQLGITTIFVTHDQEEALTISDRVVVMNHGQIEQAGTPGEIYGSPKTRFVTEFIGEANILPGHLQSRNGERQVFVAESGLELIVPAGASMQSGAAAVVLRPEALRLFACGDSRASGFANRPEGVAEAVTFLGSTSMLRVRLSPAVGLKVMQPSRPAGDASADFAPQPGQRVVVAWQPEWCSVLMT